VIHPESLALIAGLGAAWLAGCRRARLVLSRARAAAFFGGLLTLTAALNGPLHDLAERSLVSAHMTQHLLLILVAAPCLLAGTPAELIDALLGHRAVRSLVTRATAPVTALTLYASALVAWHLPGPYALTLESSLWHIAAHATMLAAAIVAWWPVLSPSRRVPALPYAAQILYLFAFGIPMTVVAAMITGSEVLLYPTASVAPLEDQRLGGILMWVPAGIVPLIAFTVVFFRWCAAEPDDGFESTE
jgi:putative membrane protein